MNPIFKYAILAFSCFFLFLFVTVALPMTLKNPSLGNIITSLGFIVLCSLGFKMFFFPKKAKPLQEHGMVAVND